MIYCMSIFITSRKLKKKWTMPLNNELFYYVQRFPYIFIHYFRWRIHREAFLTIVLVCLECMDAFKVEQVDSNMHSTHQYKRYSHQVVDLELELCGQTSVKHYHKLYRLRLANITLFMCDSISRPRYSCVKMHSSN